MMLPGPTRPGGPAVWRAVLITLAMVMAGDVVALVTVRDGRPEAAVPPPAEVAGPPLAGPAPAMPPPAPSQPSELAIPSLELQTGLVDLVLGPDGELAAPDDTSTAGWWSQGTLPGETGPAVIVGHVDSHTGPAVFFRLGELRAGDPVTVTRDDGKVVTFVVDQVQQYAKSELPTATVYGPTSGAELRLITCGGRFDKRTRSYESNVVVFAHQRDGGPA
jgi:hypothetical protein